MKKKVKNNRNFLWSQKRMSTYFDIATKSKICLQVTLHFNACIFSSMQPVPLLVLVPALQVVSLSELSPELLLIVTGKETYTW